MSNRPHGMLYVGVTGDLRLRAARHNLGVGSKFVRTYGLTRLVYAQQHENVVAAIKREKVIKHWPCEWKVRLIRRINPEWNDFYDTLGF